MAQTLSELLVAIGIDTEALTDGASGAADEVESTLGGIQTAAAGAAVGGLFMAGLNNAMDATAANATLTRQLGLSEPEAARAGKVAGDVFSAGFGESIDGVNESLQAVVSSMGGMSKNSDADLDSMTTSALMLADTFEFDVADSASAAGQMINSGLAKTGKDAFDVLTVAAQTLPKSMLEDIPATVTEYGKSWSRIGLDGKDAFGLMSQYVKAGGRDIDQAGDVLHEFARITNESTDQAAAAFKGLGLDSGKMLSDIHKGGAPAKAALGDTLKALRDLGPGAKQSGLAVQLFGDMAGEGGDALWAMDPATSSATSGMDHVAGAADKANAAMAASPSQSFDSLMRTLATTIGDTLSPALKIFSDFLADNPGLVQALAPAILLLAGALGIAAIAQWAMNSAMLANPVTWIIVAIVGLIAIIVLIATKTTWFQTIWEALKSAFSATVDGIMAALNWLGAIPGKVSGWFGQAKDWAVEKLLALVAWVITLPGRITKALSSLATNLSVTAVTAFMRFQTAAKDKANGLLTYVKSIPGRIKSALGSLGGLLLGAGKSIVQGLINGVTNMIGSLKSRFSSITNMIPDWKGPMTVDLKLLGPSGEALMSGLMDGIDDQTPALHKKLNGITADIPANVQTGVSNSGRSGSGGADTPAININIADGTDEFKALMRKLVSVDAGGDAQRFFGGAA